MGIFFVCMDNDDGDDITTCKSVSPTEVNSNEMNVT